MSEEGSEGSPPRPVRRRIRKVMVVSSTSDSDSDWSVAPLGTRRKRLRVLSDDGGESSGSSVVARRKRTLRALRDSEAESDSSGWATDPSEGLTSAAAPKKQSGFSSDSSEGNSDKCSICLLRFRDQEVGIPEACEHMFCLDCITEWSKNVNTCPVDRMVFNSITVRICAGGRVLRTEPVKVTERRPSVDIFVVEDPTPCEICGSTSNEESMLLCDGCDLGYHMQCLTPPLTEVPIDQWLCPNCDDLLDDVIDIPADLLSLAGFDVDVPFARRHRALSGHRASVSDEPSTSTGRATEPSTSRGSRGQRSGRRSNAPTRSRASKRRTRRPRTVVVEYELEGGGKLPVTRRVKRRIKKRKTGRKQRTAARRSHVRASVRAKLASHLPTIDRSQLSSAPLAELAINRQRAAIPTLSLFDSPGLEYFSDDCDVSEGALSAITAVARPTSSVLNAYRQARRKIVSIPSPPHASSAPDLLSSILDSQTLLHSKRSVVSITVDGKVDIKLESRRKIDPKKSEDATRKAPSYPGQGRTGGWGGGYRGNYHRENPTGNFSRGYDYSQATPRPLLQNPGPGPHGNEEHNNYDRRPQHYNDERFDRRRQENRNFRPEGRLSGPSWQSFGPRPQRPEPPARHSFGGFENPLDMRMTQPSAPNNYQEAPNNFRQEPSNNFHQEPQNNFRQEPNNFRQEPNNFRQEPLPRQEPNFRQEQNIPEEPPQRFQPLPEPPSFKFDRPPEIEKSEDEKSDPGLVIDTEKYDPMEPTNDESGDDEPQVISCPPPPPAPPLLQNVLASIDTSAINVSAEVLDDAVRHVIQEHRNLIMPSIVPAASDDESDGDCPNFSIYSATSVHIAEIPRETPPLRNVIQETDDIPMPHPESPQDDIESPSSAEIPEKITEVRSKEQEYKEKVSKRCPITTNPRNPIKIKINTPSLIKRVSLYDEDVPDVEEPQEEKSSNESVEKQKDSPKDKDRDSPSKSVVKANEDEEKDDEDIEENVEEDDAVEGTPPNLYEDEPLAEVNGEVMTKTDDDQDKDEEDKEPVDKDSKDEQSDDDTSEKELQVHKETTPDKVDESVEKMTESISETEDERSYTPCLDENKSKDTSLETEKEKGIEGLDTEMISEEEGNGIFSDNERAKSPAQPVVEEPAKKKKKKESKNKEKSKTKIKKSDVTFKKLSKSGKERNYRDKDKDKEDKKSKKERRSSGSGEERRARRREKRKDLERYDVRTLVTERRRRGKDAFGRDVSPPRDAFGSPPDEAGSPRKRSASRSASRKRSVSLRRRTISPRRRSISRRKSVTPRRKTISPRRRSLTPRRRSVTPRKRSLTPRRRSISPRRRSISRKRSISPKRISPRRKSGSVRRRSISPRRKSLTPRRKSISPRRKSVSPRRKSPSPRRRSGSRGRKTAARRKRSTSRPRKRVRRSASKSPKPKAKKKKRARSPPRRSPRKKKRVVVEWSPDRARTPPAPRRHRPAVRGPSKEVFTSGDNILVSVSFKDQERDRDPSDKRKRKEKRSEKRRKRKRAMVPDIESSKPVAIIDLERSPFREITPSPKNVIVLSDSDHGGKETVGPPVAPAPEPEAFPVGPKTPPEPATVKFTLAVKPAAPRPPNPLREEEQPPAAPAGPTTPPGSPDAYDPFEPTRSPSPAAVQDPPHLITLETAQKTNMSADDVIDRRPISPMEKVMALLQSTRDVSPEPPPQPASQVAAEAVVSTPAPTQTPTQTAVAPAPRIVLPSPTRSQAPKLFLAKPSPIKSNPVKPMQATKISRLPLPTPRRPLPEIEHSPGADSPYSPGSSDFGDLFSPPGAPPAAQASAPKGKQNVFDALFDKPPKKKGRSSAAKVPVKLNKKKGKTQVGVKIDEDNLKILDDLPSSAVEMQVKSKFLKKLNRQERVVEEVKLVLKPHYNKKHVTKEEYKDILRRCVPKICHNKSGEINPTKIQALVEAYVRKYRKKHKMAAS